MTLCQHCRAETGGFSLHRVAEDSTRNECGRCGAEFHQIRERPEIDDSNPV